MTLNAEADKGLQDWSVRAGARTQVCVRLWTLAGIQREMAQTTGFRVTDWLRIGLTMEVFSPTETHSPAGMRHGLYLGLEVVDE
jgi:hypothetical protein